MHHTSANKSAFVIIAGALMVLHLALAASLGACGSGSAATDDSAPTASTTSGSGAAGTATTTATTTAGPGTTVAAEPRELTVAAAAGLKVAFIDIGAAFDALNNTRTVFSFDAAGTLEKQIESGAPVDVFAAAAMTQVDPLVAEGLVDQESVTIFASNEIVLAVPVDSTLGIAGFEDLTKPEVGKVAYGDPAVAAHGMYTEEVLNHLGIFDQVKPKVIYTKNVSQTLTYVTAGEVDAGIMFSTEAMAGGDQAKVVATSEPSWHSPILFPACIVGAGERQDLAQAFIDFLTSPEGQAILLSHGFTGTPG